MQCWLSAILWKYYVFLSLYLLVAIICFYHFPRAIIFMCEISSL